MGHNTWPRVSSMDSIDNQYLLLPIQHGLVALGFFLVIFLDWDTIVPPRRTRSSWVARGRTRAHLFASYVVIAVTLTSVYLGAQTVQLFFFLTGWSEGLLLKMGGGQLATVSLAAPAPSTPLFRFQRVVS